jgi:hypothetical protein
MQLPPDVRVDTLAELLSELVDAKWAITTVVALYAAFLSTYQAFVKEWWLHRPRIRVELNAAAVLLVSPRDVLSVTVINDGYQKRRVNQGVQLQVREVMRRDKTKKSYIAQNVMFNPKDAGPLEPKDSFTALVPWESVVEIAVNERLAGTIHVRAFVHDATGKRYFSNWFPVSPGE